MSEAECRRWISEVIEWLRARKARPDQERICKMVQRRHGVAPGRTRRQLEGLLRSRAVLRVRYKGSHSYRTAAGPAPPGPEPGPGPGLEQQPQPQPGPSATRDRDRPRPRPPPPSVVLTRARHKEQQVARARGGNNNNNSNSNSNSPEAEGKRRLPLTDSGPERKKTRRTKEAAPLDSEGSDEEKAAATKDVESRRQEPHEAQNDVEPASDGGSGDGEGSPAKSPAAEDGPVEDTGEQLSAEEQLKVPSAAGQSPSQSPRHEPKDVTGTEPGQEAEERERGQVDLSPNIVGETSCPDVSVHVEEACGDPHILEPGIQQGEAGEDGGSPDQLSLADRGSTAVPQCMDNRPPAVRDQGTCQQPEPQTSEAVPEVSGASCLLTPSASPVEMVPEENGPTDRHLVEEEGKSVDPTEWSIVDVVNYFKAAGFPEQAVAFEDQEIDGKSLLLMKRNDVLTGLAIKLGPALKIYEFHIKVLQLHHFNNEAPSC